jgi:hypothetical protein
MRRFVRFRDRRSYKPSELAALFVLSLVGGMFFCLVAVTIDYLFRTFLGIG